MHARTSILVALPLPRHGESAAAELAAPHTGLGIPVLAIEGVRAHASAISTGAVAVFRAFQRAQPGVDRSARAPGLCRTLGEIISLFKILLRFIYSHLLARAAGFMAALGSVVSLCAPQPADPVFESRRRRIPDFY